MTDDQNFQTTDPLSLTVEIVRAYVGNNSLSVTDLPKLISDTYAALQALSIPAPIEVAQALQPAVPLRKSITREFLVCLEDGKRFKSLKRHLQDHGLTPDAYRKRWNLPSDYPMVAPVYSAARSALAKSIGLGRKAGTVMPRRSKGVK
jgi:predicted transcriptional regulator